MRPTGRVQRLAAHRPLVVVLLVLLAAFITACSAGSSGGQAAPSARDEAAEEGRGTSGDGTDAGGAPPLAGEPNAAPAAEQRIVRSGEITIEVDGVSTALARVRSLADELGGYVGDSQAGTVDQSATLTLRIPASRFADALLELREIGGEVLAEETREEDVTTQIVDLEARIANLEASEASYRALLERAERIEDVLAVQLRLDEVRGQIEQLKAQLEAVTGRADLSTLTVTLVPRAAPIEEQSQAWDPGAELGRAIASLVGIGQALAVGLIWFAVVWVPILLMIGVIVAILLRVAPELRRRAMPEGKPPAA
jgi:hypothetical protein